MQGIRLNLVSECPQKPTFRRLSSEEEGTAMHFAWSRGGVGGGVGWNPTRNQKLQTGVPSSESCMHSLRLMTLHQKDTKEPKHSKCHV